MKKRTNNIFWWVCGLHTGAIVLLILIPLVKGCYHPKPKEIIHFVEFVDEPAASAQPVAEPQPVTQEPEPVIETPVDESVRRIRSEY